MSSTGTDNSFSRGTLVSSDVSGDAHNDGRSLVPKRTVSRYHNLASLSQRFTLTCTTNSGDTFPFGLDYHGYRSERPRNASEMYRRLLSHSFRDTDSFRISTDSRCSAIDEEKWVEIFHAFSRDYCW